MSAKKRSQSRASTRFTRDNKVAIIVASIGAAGLIIAALVTGILEFTAPSPHPYPSSSNTGASAVPAQRASSANPTPSPELLGARPETDEFQAVVYANYAGPSGAEDQINPGQTVAVYCRVPGNVTTPSSVGSAGWYKIKSPGGDIGYAAANVFYNDPGNGRGMTPNNIKFDPDVPVC